MGGLLIELSRGDCSTQAAKLESCNVLGSDLNIRPAQAHVLRGLPQTHWMNGAARFANGTNVIVFDRVCAAKSQTRNMESGAFGPKRISLPSRCIFHNVRKFRNSNSKYEVTQDAHSCGLVAQALAVLFVVSRLSAYCAAIMVVNFPVSTWKN